MEPLHWILAVTGLGGIVTAIGVNKSRKTDAARDREQRDRIADEDRKQRAADAAADREDRKADREQRAAEAADARQGTQAIMASLERQGKALEEIIRRTSPPSPPGATGDKPDTAAGPNPDPGRHGADSAAGPARTDADESATNGAHLSPDTLNSLFGKDDPDEWMTLLGPFLWEWGAPGSAEAVKAIQARADAAPPGHPDRALGAKLIAFIRDTEARRSAA